MKKIKQSNEILWLLGIIFVALGVSICNKADLGVSMIAAPAFVVSEALSSLFEFFNVGVTEYILQGILLLFMCVIIRHFNWRYLLAFVVAVLYGYVLNFFLWILGDVQVNSVLVRWALLLLGDCLVGFGVACYFRTYMPLQVYELFVAEISRHFDIGLSKTKWCFDMVLLVISIILAFSLFGDAKTFDWSTIWRSSYHNIGIGTLVTTAINSPIISLMGKLIDRIFDAAPRFDKLKQYLGRD